MLRVSSFASIVALVILGGCSLPGPVVDRSTFFALTPDATADGSTPASLDVAVGLGPVTLPGYLDRPQLVRRVGPNEFRLDHDARWAEPLREGIVRILQQDILVASGARSVTRYPWSIASHVDLAVAVDVLRFEAGEGEDAELVARWTVRELPHGRVVAVRDSHVTEPVDGSGTGAEVAALSQALSGFAREIAAALHGAVDGGRKHP